MPIRLNLLAEAQAAEELRRRDPVKRALMKPEAQFEVESGQKLSAFEVFDASATRSAWYQAVRTFFEKYDYFILPAGQVFPFDATLALRKFDLLAITRAREQERGEADEAEEFLRIGHGFAGQKIGVGLRRGGEDRERENETRVRLVLRQGYLRAIQSA